MRETMLSLMTLKGTRQVISRVPTFSILVELLILKLKKHLKNSGGLANFGSVEKLNQTIQTMIYQMELKCRVKLIIMA